MSGKQGDDPEKVLLGKINGVFGVKGWVKVFSETDPRQNIVQYHSWYLRRERVTGSRKGLTSAETQAGASSVPRVDLAKASSEGDWRQVEILDGRLQGKNVIARLKGIDDMDAAESLRGYEIAVMRDALPELGTAEYYWRDLIGLQVRNLQDSVLGRVDRLFETGANDVLVVHRESEGTDQHESDELDESDHQENRHRDNRHREILIPWVMQSVIHRVDVAAGNIIVDWDPDWDGED